MIHLDLQWKVALQKFADESGLSIQAEPETNEYQCPIKGLIIVAGHLGYDEGWMAGANFAIIYCN